MIITIIVMLILVAVSISVALNTGLFKSAGDATKNWKTAQEEEANGEIIIDNIKYNSMEDYLYGPKLKYEVAGNKINVWLENSAYDLYLRRNNRWGRDCENYM